MHIGCGLIAHAVWDRIAKIEEKLRAMRDKRSADAPSIAEVTQEAKSSLAELEKVLAQLRGGTTSSNHSDAVEKIKSILVGAGWTGTDASNDAAAIVSVLSSQLSQAASDKSDSSPTPKP
jgi:hypothetical protein